MNPRWRWHLFSFALWLSFRTRWQWASDLMGWCVLPTWIADESELAAPIGEEPWLP